MSQPCVTTECKRPSRAVCGCCKQDFCLPHLNEHNAALVAQLNPLSDEINALGSRLTTVNVVKITDDSRQKLEQWRVDCHKTIDRLFEEKCQELDHVVTKRMDKQRDEIDRLRLKVVKLIDEHEATRQDIEQLTSSLESIKREVDKIERASVQLDVRPLVLDDSLIHVKEQLELSTFPPACKTIQRSSGSWMSLASNDRFLLIHSKPNLSLIDRKFTVAKETAWNNGDIWDMCWSSTLGRFVVLTPNEVFLVDDKTMSIEGVNTIQGHKWRSATNSETSLFLSTNVWGPSIMEFSLLPSIQLANQWRPPRTCTIDELIDRMVYNDQKILLITKNRPKETIHVELRSSSTLDRLWSFRLDTVYNEAFWVACCLFEKDEWLLIDRHSSRVLYITKDGQVRTTCAYNPAPYRAKLFGNDILAVSTNSSVNFHKL